MGRWPIAPERWDAWLAQQGTEAGFLQTAHWARIAQAINGNASHLLTVITPDALPAGGALMSAVSRGRRVDLLCHEGPVLTGPAPADQLDELLDLVERLAAELDASCVRFTGPPPAAAWVGSADIERTFRSHGYASVAWQTALVALQRSDQELMQSFRPAARKAIRRSRELGVRVVECRTLPEYLRLYLDPHGLPHQGGRALWEIDQGRAYRFWAAVDADGTVLATLGSYRWGGVATEIESRRTAAGLQSSAPAQDLLHWELFRAHRDAGDSLFNLAGFAVDPVDHKEAGIRRFKEKWGGKVVDVWGYERDRRSRMERKLRHVSRHARRAARAALDRPR